MVRVVAVDEARRAGTVHFPDHVHQKFPPLTVTMNEPGPARSYSDDAR